MQTITLIISGGIAAYKALELIRLLKKSGVRVVPVLTKGATEFITPLSASALAEEKAYSELFSLTDEMEMGHIRLARVADAVVVAPASADLLAKIAHGRADDLASTLLLATTAPVFIAPAMNPAMWAAAATQDNIAVLKKRGLTVLGPASGQTACGEEGLGRMVEPEEIADHIQKFFAKAGPLAGQTALVTAGPTVEAIDPVRFLSNHSSGKQGYAIAHALADAGAQVTLVSGPVALEMTKAVPKNVRRIDVQSAQDMMTACLKALPVDIAVCAAAVSDWRPAQSAHQKIKKENGVDPAPLALVENPDILQTISHHQARPKLVIGFAAETENLAAHAQAKLVSKGCDWVLANNIRTHPFGGDSNEILFVKANHSALWPACSKIDIAKILVREIIEATQLKKDK